METFKRVNTLVGWLVFIFASLVYILTLEPTVSWWDCGEFILGAHRLEVVHPPGAPFFLMLGKVFSLLSFGDETRVAWSINLLSGLSTSFSVLFLFWSVTMLVKKVLYQDGIYTTEKLIVTMGAGVVGAMACTFLDTLWFSAVEGELYAMSIFFMAFVFWAILKWESSDSPYADRWLILIAFSIGLSTGVHLLSLLMVPVAGIVFYMKKYEPTWKGMIVALGASFLIILVGIMQLIIPRIPWVAAISDKIFVNSFGLPFNSGFIFVTILLIAICGYALYYTHKRKMVLLNTAMLCFTFVLIGYSSYAMVPIRAAANPAINMNKPDNPYRVLRYLNREQYGKRPLMYGPIYNASAGRNAAGNWIDLNAEKMAAKNENAREKFDRVGDKYAAIDTYQEFHFNSDVNMFFPRLGWFQGEAQKRNAFRYWLEPDYLVVDRMNENNTVSERASEFFTDENWSVYLEQRLQEIYDMAVQGSITADQYQSASSQYQQLAQANRWARPERWIKAENKITGADHGIRDDVSFMDNMRFFFTYQVGYMYMRYFMWNFVGRQSNTQGTFDNDASEGGWVSGISFIDDMFGSRAWGGASVPMANAPAFYKDQKSHNTFYFLPLIIGLIGFFWLLYRYPKIFTLLFLMFIITGLLQVIYHNQPPVEPRERDYVFAGSFYTFTIFIGFGVIALFKFFSRRVTQQIAAIAAIVICLSAPLIMGFEGWDDHDRSDKYTARDFAKNYLASCEPNAILFTQGDNDTYPLWYVQEVEGFRDDVRVINLTLLTSETYADQLYYAQNNAPGLNLTIPQEIMNRKQYQLIDYYGGAPGKYGDNNKYYDLAEVLGFIADETNQLPTQSGETVPYLPTKKFTVPVDRAYAETMVNEADYGQLQNELKIDISSGRFTRADLMAFDIIASNINEIPIYFSTTTNWASNYGIERYLQQEGLAYRLVPIRAEKPETIFGFHSMDEDKMYDNVMNKFAWGGLDTQEDPYVDPETWRFIYTLRLHLAGLAENLIDNDKNDKALDILNLYRKVIPFDFRYTSLMSDETVARQYYRIDEKEAGSELLGASADILLKDLEYVKSYTSEGSRPRLILMQVFTSFVETAGKHDVALANDLVERFNVIFPNVDMEQLMSQFGRNSDFMKEIMDVDSTFESPDSILDTVLEEMQ